MSTKKKILSFFASETGRKTVFGAVCAVGFSGFAVTFVPQTFLLPNYVDQVHLYRSGIKVPVAPEIRQRVDRCLDVLGMNDMFKKLIKPFTVFGFDLFNAGNTSSLFGVAVGIPINYTFTSPDDLEKENVLVHLKPVDLTSEAGEQLAESLILPEKVQMYGICREIIMGQSLSMYLNSAYPPAVATFIYALGTRLNFQLGLLAKSALIRYPIYMILGLFGSGVYFYARDFTQGYLEQKADDKLCDLGQEFMESGITFYDKILQRNIALRSLLGEDGVNSYTKYGNIIYLFRQPSLPILYRKRYIEGRLKEHLSKVNNNNEEELM